MRLLSVLVLLLHLSTLSGLRLHVHYCGGEAESISLYDGASDCCCAPSLVPDDCCRDEVLVMQASDDAYAQSGALHFNAFTAVLVPTVFAGLERAFAWMLQPPVSVHQFADLPPPDVLALLHLRRI